MDLVLLKTFLKVAATGSITKTAALLLITQSAVSRRIKQLEDYVGSPLLDRTGTVLKPTSAGRLVIDRGRRILEIEENIFSTMAATARQKISVCSTPSLGLHRLPDLLSSFVTRHSDCLDISCVFAMPEQALTGIADGNFDLALIEHCDSLDLSGQMVHRLPHDETVFISSPRLGLPEGEISQERLLRERLYLKNLNGCARRFIDMNLSRSGRSCDDFAGVVCFDDIGFLISQVREGKGISFVSKAFVAGELERGELLAHRAADFNHLRQRSMVMSRSPRTGLVEELVELLLADLCPSPRAA